jgi:hypothetical protein
MEQLLNIQQQLHQQLQNVNQLIATQANILAGESQMPTEERLYKLIDECVRKYLTTTDSSVMGTINACLSEADQMWLSDNIKEITPFLQTPDGCQLIQHVLQAYKIYKGNQNAISTSTG